MTIYGPITDGFGNIWQVLGPRGAVLREFYTKREARAYIRGETLNVR